MNILVTGAAGFIGSNFVEVLLAQTDHTIRICDCLTYAGDIKNIEEFLKDDRVTFARTDIRDRYAVHKTMEGIDIIVHFAAETHVDRSIFSSDEFITTNIMGTVNLANEARERGVRRFVQISTDEVYGDIEAPRKSVETDLLDPKNPYSASKAAAEHLLMSYHNTYDFPVVITRCTNNYGKKQYPEKIIPHFVHKLLKGEQVPVFGDGMQIRDWIHVHDHCMAILAVMERGRIGEVYNIGADNEVRNIDLTKMILKRMGRSEDSIAYVEDRWGGDSRYSLDSTKIRTELGWSPSISFEEGLPPTIDWYMDNLV